RGKEVWIADSGAPCHITPSKERVCDYEPCTGVSVTVANSHKVPIADFGKLLVSSVGDDGQLIFCISRVAHVLELEVNLFFL
ncbi:unnamed protein product, partial [Sphacelaria rigidula]